MKLISEPMPGVCVLQPTVHKDARGFFTESYNRRDFAKLVGHVPDFVQHNHSHSKHGVIRGLHYQLRQPQGKLVQVIGGEIYDIVVDLRTDSPTFGQWVATVLSAQNCLQLWIPPGFAHGFAVTSNDAHVLYQTTTYYLPEDERCLRWDDSTLNIQWPISAPILSEKDKAGRSFQEAKAELVL